MDKIIFGARLHDARKASGLSSDSVAELCDCAPAFIRAIESGAKLPSVPRLVELCNALTVTPNTLLGNEIRFPVGEYSEVDNERVRKVALRLQRLPMGKQELVCTVLETLISQIEPF